MMSKYRFTVIVIFLTASFNAVAELSLSKPEDVGLSSEKLKEMDAHFDHYVKQGKLAGLTTLIARKGKVVHFKAYGAQNIASSKPMKLDSVFRLYSMTKPIVGVAMMMLWEERKFKLNDPVSKYLPEFKNVRVYVSQKEDGSAITEPAKREPTILDLMTHTSGLSYGFSPDNPIDVLYREAKLYDQNADLALLTKRLAELPLASHPGEKWIYSLATDVQGRLIEVLSGKSLDVYLKNKIFIPLGMNDTAFKLGQDQIERFSQFYSLPKNGSLTLYQGNGGPDYTKDPDFLSGGSGLVSTTEDYWRFAQMLANGGKFEGVRILKARTIKLMSKNHLPKHIIGIWDYDSGWGFGLNFSVVTKAEKTPGGVSRNGEIAWSGLANTLFWVDRKEKIVAILMTNILPEERIPLPEDMRSYVYGALIN